MIDGEDAQAGTLVEVLQDGKILSSATTPTNPTQPDNHYKLNIVAEDKSNITFTVWGIRAQTDKWLFENSGTDYRFDLSVNSTTLEEINISRVDTKDTKAKITNNESLNKESEPDQQLNDGEAGSQITGAAITEGLSTSTRTAAIVLGILALGGAGVFFLRKWF